MHKVRAQWGVKSAVGRPEPAAVGTRNGPCALACVNLNTAKGCNAWRSAACRLHVTLLNPGQQSATSSS